MWTYEHDSNVHWDGEDEMYWEYFTINDENGNEVARCDDEKTARLIVTVPEMLEALREVTKELDDTAYSTSVQPMIDLAYAAIAKALGETK